MDINYDIFLEEYAFRGYQADYANSLSKNEIDVESKTKIYRTTIELFMAAAVIGCYNNKRIKKAKGDQTRKIFQDAFRNHDRELRFIYQLVMLSNSNMVNSDDRINAAFRNLNDEKNWNLFEEYMLGGLEILYNHFFPKSENKISKDDFDDYFDRLFALIIEFKEIEETEDKSDDFFE